MRPARDAFNKLHNVTLSDEIFEVDFAVNYNNDVEMMNLLALPAD